MESVRGPLILVFRLLQLFRSVDLAQTWRSCSYAGTEMFVTVQRKGASKPAWEPLIEGGEPGLSPAHLIRAYVALTAAHCPPGSPLLRSLKAPYRPIKANSIGGITKRLLSALGVPMGVYGAHSTRRAGVQ